MKKSKDDEVVNTNESATEIPETPARAVGDRLWFRRSRTYIHITKVNDNGTVDIQEPDSARRFWASVSPEALLTEAPEN